jgi:hypothetical protein
LFHESFQASFPMPILFAACHRWHMTVAVR